MHTLTEAGVWQEEIRKSRFLARAVPLLAAGQAQELIAELSVAEASHNCWAWRWGDSYRYSDDGEPGGTAGRPILAAMENLRFDRVLIVVTRWYGGIQLGTGGLARAYGNCATQALQRALSEPLLERLPAICFCPYPVLERFRLRLTQTASVVQGEEFLAEGVRLELAVPEAEAAALNDFLLDLTRGGQQLEPG